MRNSFLHKIWCCLYSISNQIFIHDRRRRKMNNTNLQKNYHEEYEKHNQKLWKQQASWCLQVLFQPACGERVWSVNSRGRDATSVNQFKNCLDKYWQRYGHQKLGLTSLSTSEYKYKYKNTRKYHLYTSYPKVQKIMVVSLCFVCWGINGWHSFAESPTR